MTATEIKQIEYHVAFSFAGEDRAYVEKVAEGLSGTNVKFFYDSYEEANLWGKDLYTHLSDIYRNKAAYTVMFISKAYANKLWTNHERKNAQSRAFTENENCILPARFDDTIIPGVLETIGYIDLNKKTPAELAELIVKKLGLEKLIEFLPKKPDNKEELETLLSKSALLRIALQEVAEKGLSYATIDAILSSTIPVEDIARFWMLLAIRTSGVIRYGVAVAALRLVDKAGVGKEVVEFCLTDNNLDSDQKQDLGSKMVAVTSKEAVILCHEQFTKWIRDDVVYNTFLTAHFPTIEAVCYDELLAYLLFPNRGPGKYNIDSVFFVIARAKNAKSLLTRWIDWIRDGEFDPGHNSKTGENARILYTIFNEALEQHLEAISPVIEAAHDYVYSSLKYQKNAKRGLHHLFAMLNTRYRSSKYIVDYILPRVYGSEMTEDEYALFNRLQIAFDLLVSLFDTTSDNRDSERAFTTQMMEIAKNDRLGMS